MALILKTVLFSSVFIFCGYMETVSASYSEDVDNVFNDLRSVLNGIGTCITTAENKMHKFPSKEKDQKKAIAITNLYTQECPSPSFYSTLNSKMRSGKASGVWKTAGELINEGLDILGSQVYSMVYRGCSKFDNIPEQGETCFRFNQITSTSLTLSVTECFGGSKYLFKILNVMGLSVKDYAAYSVENEVIVKSTHVFKVKTVTTDSSVIYKEIGKTATGMTLIILDGKHTSKRSTIQDETCKGYTAYPETMSLVTIAILVIFLL